MINTVTDTVIRKVVSTAVYRVIGIAIHTVIYIKEQFLLAPCYMLDEQLITVYEYVQSSTNCLLFLNTSSSLSLSTLFSGNYSMFGEVNNRMPATQYVALKVSGRFFSY